MNTTYFLNLVSGNVFGSKTSPALPGGYYIGLSTTEPAAAGTGATEPLSSAGYARVALTSLGEPSGGAVTNGQAINFAESTASWGTVTHFVIYDAETAGNLLMYGALTTPLTVEAGGSVTIKAGALSLSALNPD